MMKKINERLYQVIEGENNFHILEEDMSNLTIYIETKKHQHRIVANVNTYKEAFAFIKNYQ